MAHILALDIGTKRTGVAYLDESVGIPLPLESIAHRNERELVQAVQTLVTERGVDRLIIGLPLL
ncbi:MAG: Holliday junction resolvase RuvX, partial [Candidatus Peribacteraceae bacterium]|nr:Holliday junction resolvase RuvX [Candidatus Peribacteraceae bacterium]